MTPTYSFCESLAASGRSRWHIRPLTDKGPRFGGGADTLAFCGLEILWDINGELSDRNLLPDRVCRKCIIAYRKLVTP